MDVPNKLKQSYNITSTIIMRQAADLSHADSVIQLPFRSNCFNWVLGHILVSRDRVLRLLNAAPVLTEGQTTFYDSESEPITQTDQAVPFATLLHAVSESESRICTALKAASAEQLATIYSAEHGQTVADRIGGLHWHETYHVGQLEILRQAAGKDDKII